MHEFSVADSMLDVIEDALGSPRPVTQVHLTLGTLSGICAEALEFCFTEIARQRGFGAPELDIEQIPATVSCEDCGLQYQSAEFYEGCPECASLRRRILSGYECNVDWVNVEED